jgi:hypothetical protein
MHESVAGSSSDSNHPDAVTSSAICTSTAGSTGLITTEAQ